MDQPDILTILRQITNEMQAASSRGKGVSSKWLDLRIARGRAAIVRAESRADMIEDCRRWAESKRNTK